MPSQLTIFEVRGAAVGALERKLRATSGRTPVDRRAGDGPQEPSSSSLRVRARARAPVEGTTLTTSGHGRRIDAHAKQATSP